MNDAFEPAKPVAANQTANAVQAEAPAAHKRASAADGLTDPDIRVKPNRTWIYHLLVLGLVILTIPCALSFLIVGPHSTAQEDTAFIQIRALTKICEDYRKNHGEFPRTLAKLLEGDKLGVIHLDDQNKFLDPWNRMYHYDPQGLNNQGLRPDIWCVSPRDGKLISNWQRKR